MEIRIPPVWSAALTKRHYMVRVVSPRRRAAQASISGMAPGYSTLG